MGWPTTQGPDAEVSAGAATGRFARRRDTDASFRSEVQRYRPGEISRRKGRLRPLPPGLRPRTKRPWRHDDTARPSRSLNGIRRQLPLAKFELIELLIGRANQRREIPQREPTSLSQFLKAIRHGRGVLLTAHTSRLTEGFPRPRRANGSPVSTIARTAQRLKSSWGFCRASCRARAIEFPPPHRPGPQTASSGLCHSIFRQEASRYLPSAPCHQKINATPSGRATYNMLLHRNVLPIY